MGLVVNTYDRKISKKFLKTMHEGLPYRKGERTVQKWFQDGTDHVISVMSEKEVQRYAKKASKQRMTLKQYVFKEMMLRFLDYQDHVILRETYLDEKASK